MTDEARNKRVVRRAIDEVINGGRMKLVDEFYTREIAADVKSWIAPFRASFPDVHMDLIELVAVFRLHDGKIAEAWGVEGTADRLRQLGLPLD